jgi:hypothetical protein
MSESVLKTNGTKPKRIPTNIFPLAHRRMHFVVPHTSETDVQFISRAVNRLTRHECRRRRIGLPPDCAFKSDKIIAE